MPVIDLSAYKPVPATLGDANQIANGLQAIQNVVNALDNNNFAAGKIFDPSKLMQNGAATGQALLWNGTIWAPAGAGAMVQLFDSTLGASAASFDITGISQAYSHLKLVLYLRGDVASTVASLLLRIDNDSGANYNWVEGLANGTAVTQGSAIGDTSWSIGQGATPGGTSPAGSFGSAEILIPHYTNTTQHKSMIATVGGDLDNTAAHMWIGTGHCRYKATAAVTRITVLPASGNWVAVSRATLYGVL